MPNRHSSSNQYRYGYGGKEKDDELKGNGNSIDFGDRMYDPRIGRWSSTDRLQSKYPWISPYSYVANNPIMNREIDGRDWTITTIKDEKGNTTIKMTLDAAVVNTSNNKALDMHCLKDAVKKQVETSYSMTYKNNDGTTTTVEATVNIRSIDKFTELVDGEHLIEVVDPSNPGLGGRTNYGRAPFNGDQLYINETKVDNIINGNDDNTIPHELGHTLGFNHPDRPLPENVGKPGQDFIPNVPSVGDNVNNAMYSGNSGYLSDKTSTEINKDQINIAKDNYDKCLLNQDTKGK